MRLRPSIRTRGKNDAERPLPAPSSAGGRDPDSSLGDIAEAAGVVRRAVYGHFGGRAALVEGRVEDAAESLRQALAALETPAPDAVTEPACFVLAVPSRTGWAPPSGRRCTSAGSRC
ncbi:TetR/AcrR family transcriptional regulator [Streptomyces sp. NPDC004270]